MTEPAADETVLTAFNPLPNAADLQDARARAEERLLALAGRYNLPLTAEEIETAVQQGALNPALEALYQQAKAEARNGAVGAQGLAVTLQALDDLLVLFPRNATLGSDALFYSLFSPNETPENIRALAAAWKQDFGGDLDAQLPEFRNSMTLPGQRMSIDFFTSDLQHKHAVPIFLRSMLPELAKHANIRILDNCPDASPEGAQAIQALVADIQKQQGGRAAYVDVSQMSDEQLLTTVRNNKTDVFMDLGSHSVGKGKPRMPLFANQRMAPVTMSYLGYPCTTGVMDYVIADPELLPEAVAAQAVTEKPVYLKGSEGTHVPYVCYTLEQRTDEQLTAPVAEKKDYITFGTLNAAIKLNDDVIHAWADILQQVPHARLRLQVPEASRDEVVAAFVRAGLTPERAKEALENWIPTGLSREQVFEAWSSIDIGLDVWPYNGGTTTCEALNTGVPVITRADGKGYGDRVGASLLKAVGMDGCIAKSREDYVAKAVEFANIYQGQSVEARQQERKDVYAKLAESPLATPALYVQSFLGAVKQAFQARQQEIRDLPNSFVSQVGGESKTLDPAQFSKPTFDPAQFQKTPIGAGVAAGVGGQISM